MRVALLLALSCLSGCASEKLALAPPSGVDFTGRWKLDEADSDDPLRIVQSQMANSGPGASGSSGSSGGRRGQGGRGGGPSGRGGGAGGGGYDAAGMGAPPAAAVGALSEALRWPGKELEIKQVAGVVAVTSAGDSRVFQPVADGDVHRHRKPPDDGAPRDRDLRIRDRGDGPPVCGWDGKTLVVESGAPDDDHPPFEERYSVSEDGQRLIEVVGFKSSRSAGFTMSRVWERVQ
jgi:hypothetical protein